MNYELMY